MRLVPEFITRNWTLKLTALALAVLLWTVTRADEPTRVPLRNVPVVVDVQDPGWTLAADPAPSSVTVVFSGPLRELVNLAGERPRVVIPVDEVSDSVEVRSLRVGWVRLQGDLERTRVEDVQPSTVRLFFDRLTTRLVPVARDVRGELPAGYELYGGIAFEPPAVRVSGPARRVERLDSVRVAPVDLGTLTRPTAITLPVDTVGLEGLVIEPRRVEAIVPVGPSLTDELLGGPRPDSGRAAPGAGPPSGVRPATPPDAGP